MNEELKSTLMARACSQELANDICAKLDELAALKAAQQPAAPAVPEGVDLWPFCRDVLKRGATIESQFSQQGYETFIAEIEHAARSEDKRLRALLAASLKDAGQP